MQTAMDLKGCGQRCCLMLRFGLIATGVILLLLGALWLVQGLGLVRIEPVACLANCQTLEGPSATWAITGLGTLVLGAALLAMGIRRQR